MIYTLMIGILLLVLYWQFSKTYIRHLNRIVGLLVAVTVVEALISLAWEQISIQLQGLWFLAPLTTLPLTIHIQFIAPFLELGHYELHLWLGHLTLFHISSPNCGVSITQRIPWAFITRALAFPLLLALNLLPIPLLYLGFLRIKHAQSSNEENAESPQ